MENLRPETRPLMTWPSGVQWQNGSYRITSLGVSRDLPTSQTTSIASSISVVSKMPNIYGRKQWQFSWGFFTAMCRQFIWFIAQGPQGGERISHPEKIQCFCAWGWVQIDTLHRLLDAFPHTWSVFLSSRMLNWALMCYLHWFRCLQLGGYVRLLVWWLSSRVINLQYNPCTMEATILSLFSALEPLISLAPSKELYTIICWCCRQREHIDSWAIQLTWLLSICFTCTLFGSMLEVMIAAKYRNLMRVFSGCPNFCYGSCASLCIIDVSRD